MKQVFDMDDRARLPWRFYGATCTILARGWRHASVHHVHHPTSQL